MNPYSGFKRGRSWDEAEPSSFGSPKLGRFDGGGAMSRPGGQQYNSQGYRGFRGEPSSDYGHQEHGWSQGASGSGGRGGFAGGSRGGFSGFGGGGAGGAGGMGRGAGSTIGRLMNMASGSGGGSSFAGSGNPSAGSYSQGCDSSFVDYSGCNQHQHSDYGSGGGGMHGQGFGGRGGSAGNFDDLRGVGSSAGGFGNFRGAGGGGSFSGHSGTPRGRGIGYDTTRQFGQESARFDVGGGSYNQNQFSSDQRAGGRGGARGGFSQRARGHRGGGERGRSGQVGRSGSHADSGSRAGVTRGVGRGSSGDRGGGGRGGDRGQGRGQRRTPGHGGTVFTRSNGTTYRRNEHSLLQYSTKFKENKLPMEIRFVNLCKMAKPRLNNMPKLVMASTTLEHFLLSDNVCLTPAYVFKGERIEETQPFNFRCKVFINNIFIASGVASNKKEAKNKGCETAIKVLGTKNSQVIIATHEKINVMALGKQDADIVECPLSSGESNIGNILSVPESNEKKSMDDFYILEPEEVDKTTGMNSTCILRQSADFSHLLLKYEFTTSEQGFLCTVNIEGKTLATSTATQQNTAKNLASHAALQNLRQTNWTINVIKRDKPIPAAKPLSATLGRIRPNDPNSHEQFTENLRAYLGTYFAGLGDHTKWLPLSQELDRDERDAVYSVAKQMNLRVESKRVDGARGKIGENNPMFLVVSKKLLCQDLFDYIWEKGGETWRYKLKAPGEIAPNVK